MPAGTGPCRGGCSALKMNGSMLKKNGSEPRRNTLHSTISGRTGGNCKKETDCVGVASFVKWSSQLRSLTLVRRRRLSFIAYVPRLAIGDAVDFALPQQRKVLKDLGNARVAAMCGGPHTLQQALQSVMSVHATSPMSFSFARSVDLPPADPNLVASPVNVVDVRPNLSSMSALFAKIRRMLWNFHYAKGRQSH